jgi:hypothetical protein
MPTMNFCEWYVWQWKMNYCQSRRLAPNSFGWNKAETAYEQFKLQGAH